MNRLLGFLATLLLFATTAIAQVIPDGTLLGRAYGDGVGLAHNVAISNLGILQGAGVTNFTDGSLCTLCSSANSTAVFVGGSSGSPSTNTSPVLIVQKYEGSTGSSNGANPAIYASVMKSVSNPNGQSARAGLFEAIDTVGWTGGTINYDEGLRATALCTATCTTAWVEGAVVVGDAAFGSSQGFVIGIEAEADPTASLATYPFNPNQFAAAFVATSGLSEPVHASHLDAFYLVNPHVTTAATALRGFYCPGAGGAGGDSTTGPLTATGACFVTDTPVAYSLDAHVSGAGNGVIWLPNNTPIIGLNAAGSANVKMIQVTPSNTVDMGTDPAATGVNIASSAVGLQLNSATISMGNIPVSGTAVSSICADASGHLFKKQTTGSCL